MAKRVFFSFHYQDVIDFRANVVRSHWVTKDREDAGFFDASIWEKSKKEGSIALKRLINSGLENTSNTCVLVGTDTHERPWVRYEILKSFLKGNHLFAVHINGIKGKDGKTKTLGVNPFQQVGCVFSNDGKSVTIYEKTGDKWLEYKDIDGKATHSYSCNEKVRGNSYNLSTFYSTYDWIADDGFNSFGSWVK